MINDYLLAVQHNKRDNQLAGQKPVKEGCKYLVRCQPQGHTRLALHCIAFAFASAFPASQPTNQPVSPACGRIPPPGLLRLCALTPSDPLISCRFEEDRCRTRGAGYGRAPCVPTLICFWGWSDPWLLFIVFLSWFYLFLFLFHRRLSMREMWLMRWPDRMGRLR